MASPDSPTATTALLGAALPPIGAALPSNDTPEPRPQSVNGRPASPNKPGEELLSNGRSPMLMKPNPVKSRLGLSEDGKPALGSGRLSEDGGWSSRNGGNDSMRGGLSSSKRVKSLKRATSLKEKAEEKIHKIDAFATKMVESSWVGGFITVAVWLATVAYVVVLVVQWVQTPPTKTVGTEWTIGVMPSPMKLTCMATSGCLVSNVLSSANTLGISAYVNPAQATCFTLAYNTAITIDMVYSVDPTEGLSVMWDPTTAKNTTSLVGGGLTLASEIRCPNSQDPGCVMILQSPYQAGTALLQYVQTSNDSATGAAANRNEWFGNMINQDSSVQAGTTPCYNPTAPDPRYTSWVQCRLRMNSFYNTVTVTKDSFWLFLFGSAGGAYALFIQLGAILLALVTFTYTMKERWAEKRRNQTEVFPEPESKV